MLKVLLLVFAGHSYTPVIQVETHSFTDCRSQGAEIVAQLKRAGNKDARFECKGRVRQ